MKKQLEMIYRCEHCNKPMFGAGAMSLHERMCPNNPKNKHKCFEWCIYLEKIEHKEYGDDIEYYVRKHYSFNCKKLNKDLYSYKLERFNRNKKRLKDIERMPLECEHYKSPEDEYLEGTDLDFDTFF